MKTAKELAVKDRKKTATKPGKVAKVMHEYKEGDLKSSSGSPVVKKSQALAIALSEARRGKK